MRSHVTQASCARVRPDVLARSTERVAGMDAYDPSSIDPSVGPLRRLDAQLHRLDAATQTHHPTETPDAVVSALHALYDVWELWKGNGKDRAMEDVVRGCVGGETALGLVWARGQATHVFVPFGEVADRFGKSFGPLFVSWRWQYYANSNDGRVERQQWYDEHVADFDVLRPMVVAQNWLESKLTNARGSAQTQMETGRVPRAEGEGTAPRRTLRTTPAAVGRAGD